jgi:hypothetical protein
MESEKERKVGTIVTFNDRGNCHWSILKRGFQEPRICLLLKKLLLDSDIVSEILKGRSNEVECPSNP